MAAIPIVYVAGATFWEFIGAAVVSLIIGGAAKVTGDAIRNKGGGGGGEPPTPDPVPDDIFEEFDYAKIKPIDPIDPTWIRS